MQVCAWICYGSITLGRRVEGYNNNLPIASLSAGLGLAVIGLLLMSGQALVGCVLDLKLSCIHLHSLHNAITSPLCPVACCITTNTLGSRGDGYNHTGLGLGCVHPLVELMGLAHTLDLKMICCTSAQLA
jgi:hypothetical protein